MPNFFSRNIKVGLRCIIKTGGIIIVIVEFINSYMKKILIFTVLASFALVVAYYVLVQDDQNYIEDNVF